MIAARKVAQIVVAEPLDARKRQSRFHVLLVLGAQTPLVALVGVAAAGDERLDRHGRRPRRLGEHRHLPRPFLAPHRKRRPAPDKHAPRLRAVQSVDELHERRLPAPVRPDDARDRARRKGGGKILDERHLAVRERYALYLNRGHRVLLFGS